MKAIELFDAYIREGLDNEQSGIIDGSSIISGGPYRMFGVHSSGVDVRDDVRYLYSYLAPDWFPGFLPIPSCVLGDSSDDMHVFLWVIED